MLKLVKSQSEDDLVYMVSTDVVRIVGKTFTNVQHEDIIRLVSKLVFDNKWGKELCGMYMDEWFKYRLNKAIIDAWEATTSISPDPTPSAKPIRLELIKLAA